MYHVPTMYHVPHQIPISYDFYCVQAVLLGKHMADEKFTRAYASDLSRAYKTAELILKHSKHARPAKIIKDVRLREKVPLIQILAFLEYL